MKTVDILRRRIRKIHLYLIIAVLTVLVVATVFVGPGEVLEKITEFIQQQFIGPLGRYYTPINSLVYGLTLFFAIVLISHLLTRLRVNVDSKFIVSVLPYILIGSAARALNDAGVYNTVLLVSPPIYFIVFGYTFMCLLLSLQVRQRGKGSFYSVFSVCGVIAAAYLIYLVVITGVPNLTGSSLIFVFAGGSFLVALPILYGIHRFFGFESLSTSCLIIGAHLLDASATHVAVSYFGYFEQHPLPNLLTRLFGTTLVLIPIKFLAPLLMIMFLDRYLTEEKQLRGMIKLTLLILGFATGTRDFLRLAMLQ